MRCNWSEVFTGPIKKAHLEAFLDDFELLKLELRLCTDMRILSFKKQAELSDADGQHRQTGYRLA